MKRATLVLLLAGFLLGLGIGYSFGLRKGVHQASAQATADYLRDSQFHMFLVARTYLDCLQAMDSTSDAAMANLQVRASAALRNYVSGADNAHSQGYKWGQFDDDVLTNVTVYLAQHPVRK